MQVRVKSPLKTVRLSEECKIDDYREPVRNDNIEEERNVSEEKVRTTRSGRIVRPPARYKEFSALASNEFDEKILIGAGATDNIPTEDLQLKNYRAAVSSGDSEMWKQAVNVEHDRMVRNNVWTAVGKDTINKFDKVLTIAWA